MQNAHKAVRAGQYLIPMQRGLVPSMEIRVHSRLILARNKGCTNARCILSRSYGHEEFTNLNHFSPQKAQKSCTGRPIPPSHTAPYGAFNGSSRTYATNPSSVQKVALMQGAYYQEAMDMKSLKI